MNYRALAKLCTKLDCVGMLVEEGLTVDQAVETLTRIDYYGEIEDAKRKQGKAARPRTGRRISKEKN